MATTTLLVRYRVAHTQVLTSTHNANIGHLSRAKPMSIPWYFQHNNAAVTPCTYSFHQARVIHRSRKVRQDQLLTNRSHVHGSVTKRCNSTLYHLYRQYVWDCTHCTVRPLFAGLTARTTARKCPASGYQLRTAVLYLPYVKQSCTEPASRPRLAPLFNTPRTHAPPPLGSWAATHPVINQTNINATRT